MKNRDMVLGLISQGKILEDSWADFWLSVADIVEQSNKPSTETVSYYLTVANDAQKSGVVFADYETYDRIFDMIVGGPIISLDEYETYGLVNVESYGYIDDWDKVLDLSMAFRGPSGLTSLIQSTIKSTLTNNGFTPLQIHVLNKPGVKVFNLPLTADYKVRIYYHNPVIAIGTLIVVIAAALTLIGVTYFVATTISRVSEDKTTVRKIEMVEKATDEVKAIREDTTLSQDVRDEAAKIELSMLDTAIKNLTMPPPERKGILPDIFDKDTVKNIVKIGAIGLGIVVVLNIVPSIVGRKS